MATVQLNEVFSADLTVATGSVNFDITLPKSGKYVVECGGTANVLVGVYQGDIISGVYGKLRICGVARRGTRLLDPVKHTITVTPKTDGTVTVKFREWNFWPDFDYFTINSYRSTC